MQNHWQSEVWRLAFVLLLGWVAGLLFGYLWLFLFVGLFIYALRNLYNLQRLVHWLSNPLDDNIPRHMGIWADIYAQAKRINDAHRQRESELQKKLQQLHDSTAALPDAIIALSGQDEIQWFNEAAGQFLALRYPQDVKQPLVNLFRNPAIVRYLQAGDFTEPLEAPAPGSQDRTLSIRITPYGDGQRLLLAQDITERLRIDQIRKDFVANVSHELRTPLTVISGFIENMGLEESECVNHWRKPLDLMEQQASRMRRIVEDLLLLARLEGHVDEARRELVDVAAIAEQVVADACSLAGDRLEITLNIESAKQLMGNFSQLHSAFANLTTNAVNYTPKGGVIRVTWSTDENGGYFIVEDNGEGISKEHLSRLTERFYRVDVGRSRSQGGTGLGLAIVKHVLQAHGAVLDMHSVVGKGSRFCCKFPASRLRIESG